MRSGRCIKSGWLMLLLLLGGCVSGPESTPEPAGVIHVVLLQFKAGVTPAQQHQVMRDSLNRLNAIPGVQAVVVGPKVRADRPVHIKDFDVGILVRLESLGALDRYGPHPAHQAFVSAHQPLFERIQVIDFAAMPGATP